MSLWNSRRKYRSNRRSGSSESEVVNSRTLVSAPCLRFSLRTGAEVQRATTLRPVWVSGVLKARSSLAQILPSSYSLYGSRRATCDNNVVGIRLPISRSLREPRCSTARRFRSLKPSILSIWGHSSNPPICPCFLRFLAPYATGFGYAAGGSVRWPRFGRSGSRKPSMCACLITRTPSCFCSSAMPWRNFSICVQWIFGRK